MILFSHGWQIIQCRLRQQIYPEPKGTMSIRVNDRCVMRSPIAKTDRRGNTIKITALSRELGNPRLTKRLVHIQKRLWEIQIKTHFNQSTRTTNLEHFRETTQLEMKLSQMQRLKQNTPCQHMQMMKRGGQRQQQTKNGVKVLDLC